MKRILLTLTLLATLSSCSNVLMYKHKRYYTEQNTIQNDTVFQLCQDVYYNPQKRGWKVIDAWHNRYLCLTFLDTNTAKTKKILNLETDTLIVTTKYEVTSVWDWNENADYKIKGKIEILQWNDDKIILKKNIVVIDYNRKQTKKYIGKRIFTRELRTQFIKLDKKQDLYTLNFNFCDTFSVEITGLYPILDKLPNAETDSIISKILFIENGFTQTDWGRGNWEKGPRFIYLEYKRDDCTCKIFKKYYRTIGKQLRVSERIICNTDKFMD